MDCNNVRPIQVSINTKFVKFLQPGWSKYVTMVHHNQTGDTVSYDVLYDSLVLFEPRVLASKAKKAAKNHDPLALIAHSNASSSQSHANSTNSPQPHYVTHPSLVVDYEDEYQEELQGDSQEDKLTTAMMLLARVITQKFSTPTNNRLRTSSNITVGNAETVPSYDAKAVSEVNASSKVHKQYLEDIVDLEEKLSFRDRIIYKMGQSIQTIHMLGKKPNTVYDHFLKAGLGYKNLERLKKAIAAQPKMYDDEMLHECEVTGFDLSALTLVFDSFLALTAMFLGNGVTQRSVPEGKNVNTNFDKSETSGTLLCVTPLPKNIAVKAKKLSNTKVNADRSKPVTSHSIPKNEQSQKQSANVITRGMYKITEIETQSPNSKSNMNVSNSTSVESSNSIRRPKSKDTKSKDKVLKNNNDKRPFAHVQKISSSVSIDSNKHETMHSNVCQSNTSVLSTKTVNAVNDGSNIVCVSCAKDMFLLSHEKRVARYALSRNSSVKEPYSLPP
nr:hypothetical protein [Tanacetum cinerariifolium]